MKDVLIAQIGKMQMHITEAVCHGEVSAVLSQVLFLCYTNPKKKACAIHGSMAVPQGLALEVVFFLCSVESLS